MVDRSGRFGRYKKPLLMAGIIALAVVAIAVIAVTIIFCYFLYVLGSIDDPFRPRPPDYQ